MPAGATVVHLDGTPHPNPSKAAEFERVDLASIRATCYAARASAARHLIYVSVAHPAPVMRAYIAVRCQGEDLIAATGLPATILRPWYVLGPGHRWPHLLTPIYAILRRAFPDASDRIAGSGRVVGTVCGPQPARPPIAMMLSMPSGLILIGCVFALGVVRWRTPSRTAVQ